jgi:membrane associated rhomboid family serine protease
MDRVSEHDTETDAPECYLHPGRPALLRCSRCERPICADDAIEAPVGYQCRECAAGGQRVRHVRELIPEAQVTKVLVGIIAVLFLATSAAPELIQRFGLRPLLLVPGGVEVLDAIAAWYVPTGLAEAVGEPWLLVSSGFLHANLMHVGFNGYLLWMLGRMLEPSLGHGRFAALYGAGLAGGGLGVVLLAWLLTATPLSSFPGLANLLGGNPLTPTVGASGAVFGLMGAAVVGLRNRGIDPWRTDIGTLVLLNLVITFVIPGISVGGHLGGLLAGMAVGKLLFVDHEGARRATWLAVLAAVGMAGLAVLLAGATVAALVG